MIDCEENKIQISASLMCIDWLKAEEQVQTLYDASIDMLHIDVIDGRYAPDFTMGTSIINCFRDIFKRPFDYHLMVEEPSRIFDSFEIKSGDSFAIHQECCRNLHKDLISLRKMGAKVGVALSPKTDINTLDYIIEDLDYVLLLTVNPGFKGQTIIPNALEKIRDLKDYISKRRLNVGIHVDGNVSIQNIPDMIERGADTLISGSSGMFIKNQDLKESINIFKKTIKIATHGKT